MRIMVRHLLYTYLDLQANPPEEKDGVVAKSAPLLLLLLMLYYLSGLATYVGL
jgi:hypothetical protein